MVRSPKRPAGVVAVPMVPTGTAFYGEIFGPSDIPAIVEAVGLPLSANTSAIALANLLDDAAVQLVLGTHAFAADTATSCARWAREVEQRAASLLACFFADGNPYGSIDEAVNVLRGPTGYVRPDDWPSVPRRELPEAIQGVLAVARRAAVVAAQYEIRSGAKRRPAETELMFVRGLSAIFERAFGASWTVSTSPTGERGGSGVRFCGAVAKNVSSKFTDSDPARDGALRAALSRLQDPDRAADRIRDAGSGGMVRKR